METLGVRLKRLRSSKKITQQKLADAIGVSKTSVIYWEKDENVPKQDCETNAFKRLAPRLKKKYPQLPICILGDSLYATEPIFDICKKFPLENNFALVVV